MRPCAGRRSLIAGILLFSILVAALAGCQGKETSPASPTGAALTVTATAEAASPSPTPAPTETPRPTQASTSVTPMVVIWPTHGPAGTELSATATGFRPNTTVRLGLGRQGDFIDATITAESDADGRVVQALSIPESATPGDRWVVVAQIVGQPVQGMSNLFEVTEAGGEATIQVAPTSGVPGAQLQVTGSGFPAEVQVDVGIGLSGAEPAIFTQSRTHADGVLAAAISIPESAAAGETWAVLVSTPGGAIRVLSEGIAVLEAVGEATAIPATATPGAVPATPEPLAGPSVQVYLIALEDAGQSGPAIGCGDSVVPVRVPIAQPTAAVLRASMEALVSLNDRYYGESGLYNALYQSDLTVGAIGLAAGQATIHLSGSLIMGGACDAPRVKAQLEQTALQFSTVNQVTIYINGETLDSVLSGQ